MDYGGQEEVLSDSKTKRCPICEIYQRKIQEVEENLAGRDAIISLLQNRLKKCEDSYKGLFDDFEKLRFEYCTAVQDNYSLKEINAKLEKEDLKSTGAAGKNIPQRDQHSSVYCYDERKCIESSSQALPEIDNIENLINAQNEVLKRVLDKIMRELKFCKSSNAELAENSAKLDEDLKSVESGDSLNEDPQLRELLNEIKNLKKLLETYKEDNQTMKALLNDKKKSLTECQHILEDTSKSINQISSSIDNIVKNNAPDNKGSKECMKNGSQSTATNTEQYDKNRLSELETEMKQKEQEYEDYKRQSQNQMNDISNNNQMLSDTLDIIKEENKNNLEITEKLKEELKRVNEEYETQQTDMKSKISELENELEGSLDHEKKLEESLENSNEEIKKLKERMRLLIEENKNYQGCQTKSSSGKVSGTDLTKKISDLEDTNTAMKKDLTEKALELSEYEEENRALSQKVESLTGYNNTLQNRINELNEQLNNKPEKVGRAISNSHMSADFSVTDLKNQVNQMEEENKSKLRKIDSLKTIINFQTNELEQLRLENANLKEQLEKQKDENKNETEKLQEMVGRATSVTQMSADFRVKDMENQMNEMEEENKCLTGDCKKYKTELKNKSGTISSLNNLLNSQTKQLEQLRQENTNLKEQLERQKDENKKEIEKLQEMVGRAASVTQRSADFRVKDLENQVDQMGKENKSLTSDCQKYETEIKNKSGTITSLNCLLNSQTNQLEQLRKENGSLKEQLEKQKSETKEEPEKYYEEVGRVTSNKSKCGDTNSINRSLNSPVNQLEQSQKGSGCSAGGVGRAASNKSKCGDTDYLNRSLNSQANQLEQLQKGSANSKELLERQKNDINKETEKPYEMGVERAASNKSKCGGSDYLNRSLNSQANQLEKLRKESANSKELLERQKNETNKETEKPYEMVGRCANFPQMSADFSIADLKNQVNQLAEKNKCLSDDCKKYKIEINNKLGEIDSLKILLNTQTNQLEQLQRENANLKEQLEKQKNDNKKETEKLQDMVNHSQCQVELLLQEHDEKTLQIQNVANELDAIRKSVTEENNSFMTKIEQLERERDELKKQVENYEHIQKSNCQCGVSRSEIERLKAESAKKQFMISELEGTIDNFNLTMKQFERNIVDLDNENLRLKDDKDKYIKELKNLQNQLVDKIAENTKIQEDLENFKIACQNCKTSSKSLEIVNGKLKSDIEAMKLENEKTKRILETEKLELQMQLEKLKDEQSKKNSVAPEELENVQKAYNDLRDECTKKCLANDKLCIELANIKRISEELKKTAEYLDSENERLRNQTRASVEGQYKANENMNNLKELYDKMRRESASKSVDVENLKAQLEEIKKECANCDCESLRKKMTDNEKKFVDVNEKYNELQKMYDQQYQELRKSKKQYESCCKQCQISREEYNNLRREYKSIKVMLSDQIKKYKNDVGNTATGSAKPKTCMVINDFKKKLLEKEEQMAILQQKLKDASYEIIELKDYIHKLISDNNILKSAINNLIGNLERKIKGPSFGNLPGNSADSLAGEILQSLTNIEDIITKKTQSRCPRGCPGQVCDCMKEIQLQYNAKEPQQGPSRPTENNAEYEPTSLDPATRPKIRISANFFSDPSTTDSEECHCTKFLDKRSLEFLKDAVQGLKMSRNSTNKEKLCDCEQFRCKDKGGNL